MKNVLVYFGFFQSRRFAKFHDRVFAVIGLAALLFIVPAGASEAPLLLVKKEALDDGGLFFITDKPGLYVPAPRLKTDVDISVNGIVARVKVTQSFTNTTGQWVEGIYTFPLPDKSAVDRLAMIIGERRVVGEIKEKEEARKAYEQARAEGRRASLVSQERPNIFTNEVANIGPGETVLVEIEYQDQARFQDGDFELRFPMVVRPRYIPGNPLPVTPEGMGWSYDSDQVPDASRITPVMVHPDFGKINPVEIAVLLNPGFRLSEVSSPSHDVDIRNERGSYEIVLKKGSVPADSDFILKWSPEPASVPATGLFSQKIDDAYFHLLMVIPRSEEEGANRDVLAREAVFIIDVSGSMAGEAIRQAKAALLLALEGLTPRDRFRIITFNNSPYDLFKGAVPAGYENLRHARDFVSRLVAGGGTEMAGALDIALNNGVNLDRLRQVVFMTDGAVGNEDYLFQMISDRLGDSRLFTVGIGSSPNSHFMREAAAVGKGTFTYIGNLAEVDEKMSALFKKLENPVLKDLTLEVPGIQNVEKYPERLPDVYAGEPVVIAFKTPGKLKDEIVVKGILSGREWAQSVDPAKKSKDSGISALWAREKIRDLTNRATRAGELRSPEYRKAVVEIALAHQMVSRFTSLIAIDDEIARKGEALTSTPIPVNLPKGMDPSMVGGKDIPAAFYLVPSADDSEIVTVTGTRIPRRDLAANSSVAVTGAGKIGLNKPLHLPQTATGLWQRIWFGLMFLIPGVVLLYLLGKRRPLARRL